MTIDLHDLESQNKSEFIMNECKWYPICPIKRFTEQGKINKYWVKNYCKGEWNNCIRYKMEEQGEYHPDWMMPDGNIDKKLKDFLNKTK